MRLIIYILQKGIWPPFVLMLKVFFKFKVEGRENFKLLNGKQYIIAANHCNYADAFLVSASIPFFHFLRAEFRYMTEAKYTKIFPFIPFFGAYSIYRGNGVLDETLAETNKLLEEGKHLLVFPEGRRSVDGRPVEARIGIAYLAKKHNLPILPICLKGNLGLGSIKSFFNGHTLTAKIGKSFYYGELGEISDDYELAQKIMGRVCELL